MEENAQYLKDSKPAQLLDPINLETNNFNKKIEDIIQKNEIIIKGKTKFENQIKINNI